MSSKLREFDGLLHRLCEESLTPAEHQRLIELLREDPACRQRYLGYVDLHATLTMVHGGKSADSAPSVEKPQATALRPVASRPSALSAVLAASVNWKSHPVLFGFVSLMLTGWLWLWVISVVSITHRPSAPPPPGALVAQRPRKTPPAARLVENHACQWIDAGTAPRIGQTLDVDRVWELTSGLAEIEFPRGARALVEGPARFAVDAQNQLRLDHGRVVCQVPARGRGFVVRTPLARVIDLGSEFGVRTAPDGATDVVVFSGEVEIALNAGPNASANSAPRMLRTGEAARVTSARRFALQREVPDIAFTRKPPRGRAKTIVLSDGQGDPNQLRFPPAWDDLLQGKHAESSLPLADGDLAWLTDGFNTDLYQQDGRQQRTIAVNTPEPWVLTYDLELPDDRAARIEEIRVFSYNVDARVFQDYTVEVSLDGVTWTPLGDRVTHGERGEDFNLPAFTRPDYFHDYGLTAILRANLLPGGEAARHVRFQFEPVAARSDPKRFAVADANLHTLLTEIDVIGEIAPWEKPQVESPGRP